jgi:hypothetical protein
MKTYTIEEQDKIGQEIAELFLMKHVKENRKRWKTFWGSKTNVGIFNTILRIAEDLEAGTFKA